MSHVALLVTSVACGHCQNMRGTGRLLSQNEIKQQKKQPNIPGGHHYDSKFMRKLLMAGTNEAKFRVININFNSMNPSQGVADISVFTLETDQNNVRQTILKNVGGKTEISIYVIGETGRVVSTQEVPREWTEFEKEYVPVNIMGYSVFYPSIIAVEGSAWAEGIKNKTPIYGFLNGFDTKEESPYGAVVDRAKQPNVLPFETFLGSFFNGGRKLLGKPEIVKVVVEEKKEEVVEVPIAKKKVTIQEEERMEVPTSGSKKRFNFKLYVVEK